MKSVICSFMTLKLTTRISTMPAESDRPLRKCTLNLYADDVAYLESSYGPGWTVEVRRAVSDRVRQRQDLAAAVRGVYNE